MTGHRLSDFMTSLAVEGSSSPEYSTSKESPGWASWVVAGQPGRAHEVHGVTEHLRITRSTSPPLPGGPAGAVAYSPVELRLASSYTLAS